MTSKRRVSELHERWVGQDARVAAIITELKADKPWTRHLVDSRWGRPLPYMGECDRAVVAGEVAPRDLRGITLEDLNLTESNVLSDTALDYALLYNVHLEGASITGSSFCHAVVSGTSSLSGVKAYEALFIAADCRGISFKDADFKRANLCGCDLREADLTNCRLEHIDFDREGALGRLGRRRWTRFGGAHQTMSDLHPETRLRVRKHIAISSEIMDLHRQHPVSAWIWYLLANYGRSAGRLAYIALATWLGFGCAYALWPAPPFSVSDCPPATLSLTEALYLSAVTITTLGYGDIVPGVDGIARLLVGAEAVSGVVLMGALVAILIQNATLNSD